MPASTLPTIRIAEADVQVVEYRGERVVTFKQIDAVHGRPEGTARRNFNENRERFVEGEDFVELTANEIRTQSMQAVFAARTGKGIILTRRGYLKLTKPMNDDRAWTVFNDMLDRYFAFQQPIAAAAAASISDPREIRLVTNQALKLAKLAGLDGVHAFHAASAQTFRITGYDTLAAMGLARLPAPEDEKPLILTQIGERLGGLSARTVNILLQQHGFQSKDERDEWVPSERGRDAGAHYVVAARKHAEGTAYQLVWHPRIVASLRDAMASGGNILPFPA